MLCFQKLDYQGKLGCNVAHKGEQRSGHHPKLNNDLLSTTKLLVADKPLPVRNYDHALNGK